MLKRVLAALVIASAVAIANADSFRVSGLVKGSPKGTTFMIGSNKGTFTIDASKAKATMKGGGRLDISKLTGGSNVTIEGELKGKDKVDAKTVVCNFLREPGAIKKKSDEAEKPVEKKTSKKKSDKKEEMKEEAPATPPVGEKKRTSKKSDKKSEEKKTEDKKAEDNKAEEKKETKKSSKKDSKKTADKKEEDKKETDKKESDKKDSKKSDKKDPKKKDNKKDDKKDEKKPG